MRTRRALVWAVALGVAFVTGAGVGFGQGCPELLGRWPYGPAYTVAVNGATAYLGCGAGLRVVDVSTPAAPVGLGDVQLPDLVWDVAVAGAYAYVVGPDSGLEILTSCSGLLFADGFESGDATRWSAVMP